MRYEIQFYDYWHTGSGLSAGTRADQVVNKTPDGFPLVPGKTIKGLLRHAAEDLQALGHQNITKDFLHDIFGERHRKRNDNSNADHPDRKTTIAKSYFSNAELSPATRKALSEDKSYLYEVISSTAIDSQTGTAEHHSLRQMEVTIPLKLYGSIEFNDDLPNYTIALTACMNYVKRLGQNRSRGLGRCRIQPIDA